MNRAFVLGFLFLVGCNPIFVRKWDVQYKVIKLSPEPITYSVSYTNLGGVTQTEGPIIDSVWSSEVIREMPSGQPIDFSVKIAQGTASLELQVLRNTALHSFKTIDFPDKEVKIETEL